MMIHMNMQEMASVLRTVSSKTLVLKRPLNSAASVAARAPTAELSTRLVTPMTYSPVIEKKMSSGSSPAHYGLNLRDPKAKDFLLQNMEQFLFQAQSGVERAIPPPG
jgi:hypothetical protein